MAGRRVAHLLDGRSLTVPAVLAVARHGGTAELTEPARAAVVRAHEVGAALDADAASVYGRTTGVGARKDTPVADSREHAMRLLRSHAAGAGPLLSPERVRAMLVVRLGQLGAGGSGVGPAVVAGVERALALDVVPQVHEFGSIGTGDVTALAEAGLALAGEGRWLGAGEPPPPASFGPGDALAWMSSSACTLGSAALALADCGVLLSAAEEVAALALLGVRGNPEPFHPLVHAGAPPGQVASAARMRDLLAGMAGPPARLQDAFAFRCAAQVQGAARDAHEAAGRVLTGRLNAAEENPLLAPGPVAVHNGNFLQTGLALALDQLRAALLQLGMAAVRQLAGLLDAHQTGLPPFLAGAEPASSGLMVLEYTAQSALAELRALAQSVTLATAAASHGVEDGASFADLAVRQLARSRRPLSVILGCTLLAAVRALRMRGEKPVAPELLVAYERAAGALAADLPDRPLGDDIAAAAWVVGGVTHRPVGPVCPAGRQPPQPAA